MDDYYVVQTRSTARFSTHDTQAAAYKEAKIIANNQGYACVMIMIKEFPDQPKPELRDWSIDKMLDFTMSRAKTSHRWTCIYAILNRLKNDGVTTLQAPEPDNGFR